MQRARNHVLCKINARRIPAPVRRSPLATSVLRRGSPHRPRRFRAPTALATAISIPKNLTQKLKRSLTDPTPDAQACRCGTAQSAAEATFATARKIDSTGWVTADPDLPGR
jgi:hypothetical protein